MPLTAMRGSISALPGWRLARSPWLAPSRAGRLSSFRSRDRIRAVPCRTAAHKVLIPRMAALYRRFPTVQNGSTYDCQRYRFRVTTFPGRGLRTAAPDGAFGLFGDRDLSA